MLLALTATQFPVNQREHVINGQVQGVEVSFEFARVLTAVAPLPDPSLPLPARPATSVPRKFEVPPSSARSTCRCPTSLCLLSCFCLLRAIFIPNSLFNLLSLYSCHSLHNNNRSSTPRRHSRQLNCLPNTQTSAVARRRATYREHCVNYTLGSDGLPYRGRMPPFPASYEGPLSSLSHPLALRSLLPSLPNLAPRSHKQPLPTRTLPSFESIPRSLASLFRRQTFTVTATASPTTSTVTATPLIPANYAGINAGPAPGTVVGIVFGSVAGFLLILWLIYTCFSFAGGGGGRSSVIEEEVIRRHSRSRSRRASSPRRSSPRRPPSSHSASEVIEVRSTRHTTPPPRRESRRETVVIEETRRPAPPPEDDIVEVIEEHSPEPPRERSRKPSGFRTIDPEAFGGGNRPQRKVSRR